MYVFVDDSGDPGFKFGQGSSNFLVIACCVFKTSIDVEKASRHVLAVKQKLNGNKEFELKFHKSRQKTKIRFLLSLEELDFHISALVVDKRKMSKSSELTIKALTIALSKLERTEVPLKITIDGILPKKTALTLSTAIRRNLKEFNIDVDFIRFRDSKAEPLIQLTDLVAGSIRATREYNDHASREIGEALESVYRRPKSVVHDLNS